jgi:hypothetical protein
LAHACATTPEAAPSVAVFDGWVPRTHAQRAFCEAFKQRFKEALKFYLKNVAPAQQLARTEVMKAFEQSVARNRDLLDRLAK